MPRPLAPRLAAALLAAALMPTVGAHGAAARVPASRVATEPGTERTNHFDFDRRYDFSDVDMWTTNIGSLAFDIGAGAPGLRYPLGAQSTVMFASGLWVGATVQGVPRVTVAEYSQEWGPGRIVGGQPEYRFQEALRTYKVITTNAQPLNLADPDTGFALGLPDRDPIAHDGWSDYLANAVPFGAPLGFRRMPDLGTPDPNDSLDVPGPDLPGDLALWSVFNDADPTLHTNDAGGSAPLGLEVRQTVFGRFDGPAVYVRWQIVNRGSNTLQDAYIGFWSDPDLGNPIDDLAGYDAALAMGYTYNATNNDTQYGSTPPAVGTMLLLGPLDPAAGVRRPAYAFERYINGTDPNSTAHSYNALRGLDQFGAPVIDPTTSLPTRYQVTGDPVQGTGWLDVNPADRRALLSAGPITLAPGQSTDLVVAFVVQRGNNRLDSIDRLRCSAAYARELFLKGLPIPAPPVDCPLEAACPAPASFFAGICDAPESFPPSAVDVLANCADAASASFSPGPPLVTRWCEALHAGPGSTPRERALREYLTLLANSCALATGPALAGPIGSRVGIRGDAPASCPPLEATTVAELLASASGSPGTVAGDYLNDVNPAGANGLLPVSWGGTGFGGGAGSAFNFFGSTLDPAAEPDSFPRVELRFDPAIGQKAYRYLRMQLSDGSAPPNGREYRYAGFRTVPLTARDASNGSPLEVAFVELANVLPDGTLLPPAQQPATFDSTWGPDTSPDGAREYLIVFRRGYSGAPRPLFAVNGAIMDGSLPGLYALWSARAAGGTIDPGDGFFWQLTTPGQGGVDAYLLALGAQPQNDPDVIAAYEALADCLAHINSGATLGAACDVSVPALLYLEASEASESGVRLVWYAGDRQSGAFALERRRDDAEWNTIAMLRPDGQGRLVYKDTDIAPGDRLAYRMRDPRSGQLVAGGTADIIVPAAEPVGALELAGVVPDGDGILVRFHLPRAGVVRLELFNALGRRVAGLDLGAIEAGTYTKRIGSAQARGSGLYFVRLRVGTEERVAKALFTSR